MFINYSLTFVSIGDCDQERPLFFCRIRYLVRAVPPFGGASVGPTSLWFTTVWSVKGLRPFARRPTPSSS